MPEDSSKPVAKPVQRVAADLINPSVLAALKQAFLVRIGPIGEMLFTRIYSDWSSEPGAGISGLGTLVTRIASEIDDPADQKAFLHEVRNVIG